MSEERWIGPPGAGKTHKLSELVAASVARYGEKGVIVCSFSKAAAKVAAARVELPDRQVDTLHALCLRALGQELGEKLPVHSAVSVKPTWNEWITGRGRASWAMSGEGVTEDVLGRTTEGDVLLEDHGVLRMRMEEFKPHTKLFDFDKLWTEWKHEVGCIDFTDMIAFAHEVLDEAPFKPKVIAVDECQDLTRLEYTLLRKWADAGAHLILVGDAHQAIHGRRGASPECFYEGEAPTHTLEQSYRVPRAVHSVAMGLMGVSRLPKVSYHPRDAEGQVERLPHLFQSMPRMWLPGVRSRVEKGQSVMILGACRHFLKPVIAEMRDARMIYHNPFAPTRHEWNPLGRIIDSLRAFLRPDGSATATPAMWSFADLLAWIAPMSVKGNLTPGAKQEIEDIADIVKEQRLGLAPSFDQLDLWFTPEAIERVLSYDVRWWQSTFTAAWKKKQGLAYACDLVCSDRGALMVKPQIIVGTIHSVKGGEADSVFLSPRISPAWWEEYRRDKEGLVRLFYVGVTRAREELILMGGEAKAPKVWFW